MITPEGRIVRLALSVRAQTALTRAIWGGMLGDDTAKRHRDDVGILTRVQVRRQLVARFHHEDELTLTAMRRAPAGEIRRLLLSTRGCGVIATNEIMRWLGVAFSDEPHKCVCRKCGRRMR